MKYEDRIFVAGGETLVGASLIRSLKGRGFSNVIGGSNDQPNLSDSIQVSLFFKDAKPDYVIMAAGRGGGIGINQSSPADLMVDNLLVSTNVIQESYKNGVTKLLYLGSSCCYPKFCEQPMNVQNLLSGALEPTNECYAVAKLAGIKLCQAYNRQYGANFISAIPGDVYGPGDDFSPDNSHVVAGLMNRTHVAKTSGDQYVEIWGTGTPRREFLFVDDLSDACVFLMENYNDISPINIGSGMVLPISELADNIKTVVGYNGELRFDTTKPDGMPLKALDSGHINKLGWKSETAFLVGLSNTYKWFLESRSNDSL